MSRTPGSGVGGRDAVARSAAPALAVGLATTLGATPVAAYLMAWPGAAIAPWTAALIGLCTGLALARAIRRATPHDDPPALAWALVVLPVLVCLLALAWPALLPPGGASDLTHHLLLVDVLERTRHLPDGTAAEAAMGEMAHYTPGLHLLIVIAGSLSGVAADRAAYPLLAITIALKAGFVFLAAHDASRHLRDARARLAMAAAALPLALWAPRAYSVDAFLQAGFHAQVVAELFAVAAWWALGRWWVAPHPAWMAFVGLAGAAVFLVWPILIGPVMLAAGAGLLVARGLAPAARARQAALAIVPVSAVAALHLWQHAAWLRIAGTSGAVPPLAPDPLAVALVGLALLGAVPAARRAEGRATLVFGGAIALQAVALWLLARARGAETPYMAMKMIYLAVYPAAVLAATGLGAMVSRAGRPGAAAWAAAAAAAALAVRATTGAPVPRSIMDVDLEAAGRWARANLEGACVDYVVEDGDRAYWLHLAVLGQPRASARTADLDGYTANRAIGRWIEGAALPYAVATRALLPGEVIDGAEVLATFGSAVVLGRRGPVPTSCGARPGGT